MFRFKLRSWKQTLRLRHPPGVPSSALVPIVDDHYKPMVIRSTPWCRYKSHWNSEINTILLVTTQSYTIPWHVEESTFYNILLYTQFQKLIKQKVYIKDNTYRLLEKIIIVWLVYLWLIKNKSSTKFGRVFYLYSLFTRHIYTELYVLRKLSLSPEVTNPHKTQKWKDNISIMEGAIITWELMFPILNCYNRHL